MKIKAAIKKAADILLKCENFIVIVCCIAMISLVFMTVFIRYIFRTGYQGMEELVMLFAFGIYFIGAALGTYHETQITADMMSLFVRDPHKMHFIRAIQCLIDATLIGLCAIYSTQQMLFMYHLGGRTTGLKVPIWIQYTIVLVGLFLMSIYAFWHCWDYISTFVREEKEMKAAKAAVNAVHAGELEAEVVPAEAEKGGNE